MADEADALEGEPNAEAQESTEHKSKTVEELAAELGWKPEDQWQGDKENWQPAEQYLRAPREKRDDSKRELRGLRDQLGRLTDTSSRILADRLAEKDRELAALQAKFVEDGDSAGVDRVVKQRIELQGSAAPSGPPPETLEFQERNKAWFGAHPRATALAKRIAAELAQDGHDAPTQLREAEAEVKRVYPELFPAPAKRQAATQTGGSRTATTSSAAKGYADMPAESRKMADEYERRHGIKKEDFAKSYWEDEAKRQRRVG